MAKLDLPMLDGEPQPGTVNFTEVNEIWHTNHLITFKKEIFPIYEKAGFTLQEAMIFAQLTNIASTLDQIEAKLEDGGFKL